MTRALKAGCPQGSVLGPLLAIMYLNGLVDTTTNDVLLFADDTSLHRPHTTDRNIIATQHSLQTDLDGIYHYGTQWAITFNETKTVQQTFTHKLNTTSPCLKFGGQPVPIANEHKHLGLTFSSDLRFHSHINEIITKVNRTMSPLYPIAKYLSRNTLTQIYTAYILPIFDYCDVIYDGQITMQDAQRLETTQNRAARLITGTPFRTSTDRLRQDLGLTTLSARRKLHKIILYHNIGHNPKVPECIKNILRNTRQRTRHTKNT